MASCHLSRSHAGYFHVFPAQSLGVSYVGGTPVKTTFSKPEH